MMTAKRTGVTLGSPSVCPERTVQMKRAARFKTGRIVFDKRRKTWRFLEWHEGRRRTRMIGTLKQFPPKGAAKRAAQAFKPLAPKPVVIQKGEDQSTVKALA